MALKPATSQSPLPSGYWEQSTRPLVSLCFVTPLLGVYEVAALLGPAADRNGADVWLRWLLSIVGLGQHLVLPLSTCGVLLAWHYARRDPWRASGRVIGLMALESTAWGLALLGVARAATLLFGGGPAEAPIAAAADSTGRFAASFVGYLGAGIYEELLFRLLLVPLAMALLQAAGLNRKASLVAAAALTSLLFATAHYSIVGDWLNPGTNWRRGEPFTWLGFSFRFFAGVALAMLFVRRGFGVAVGAHTAYDALVLAAGTAA